MEECVEPAIDDLSRPKCELSRAGSRAATADAALGRVGVAGAVRPIASASFLPKDRTAIRSLRASIWPWPSTRKSGALPKTQGQNLSKDP